MELTIGVDVGGTKIAAGVVDEQGRMVDHLRVPTPKSTAETTDGIVAAVLTLQKRHPATAVGLAAAGFIDERRTGVRFAPNLPWRDYPLGTIVSERLGVPVVVENDANAAAWAEYRFGAGRRVDDMVLLTVGTGLGGGIVLAGRLIRGSFGIAAELGHIRMVRGGLLCGCGQRGCWEMYAAGRALVRSGRAKVTDDPAAGRVLLASANGDPAALEGHMITAAAIGGDPLAVSLLAELGSWLGEGIADLAAMLDPAMVVVGGGVADAGDLLLEPARQTFVPLLSGGGFRPTLSIRAAELGNHAGIIGVADLARHP